MFEFLSRNKMSDAAPVHPAPAPAPKPHEAHALDALTGGAFSAATAGERAARIRDWLATQPAPGQLQEVFRELSARDKGAARAVRVRIDEIRRARGQEAMAADWADKARALLAAQRLNIADALAWQRDAAKAGAPLSREPLALLKTQLAERVKIIEDLQHRVQVQREAAVLLGQRMELLSTRPWRDAQAAREALCADAEHWQQQAQALTGDAHWSSVEPRFPALLESARSQLLQLRDALQAALAQAECAAHDSAAPLPPVPVWAEELRAARAQAAAAAASAEAGARPERAPKPETAPEVLENAARLVRQALATLQEQTAAGQGKASVAAAAALRAVLKTQGRHIDNRLEQQVHAALVAAGELQGWQRWSADQLREDLLARAEALLKRPEGQALGGRRMQESLRALREQWKQADQGGAPNHALWKRFDEACSAAHKVVEAWLEKVRSQTAEHKAQRLALIEELRAWGQEHGAADDWRALQRALQQFAGRWRDSGHVGDKLFAELQPLWKQALDQAGAPLAAAQQQSLARRQALIDEATALGAEPALRIDAIKALQQRWQAEAQSVPIDRRQEQKLWDAFRKPLDEAFNRKSAERERALGESGAHDRLVLEAARALEAANASADAQQIRAAMQALEAALRGQAQAAQALAGAPQPQRDRQNQPEVQPEAAPDAAENMADAASPQASAAATGDEANAGPGPTADSDAAPPAPAKPAARPVVAVRGDDRPGKAAPAGHALRPGERAAKHGAERRDGRPGAHGRDRDRDRGDHGRRGDPAAAHRAYAAPPEERGPRLGSSAFRAQREALEHAQQALKKLAAQAHGEALTRLLTAWEQRAADQLPGPQELGPRVAPALRSAWLQALSGPPRGDCAQPLLRLEMAAETPSPPEHMAARRMLQLQLLTRRNDPPPAQTWGQDTAAVLASACDSASARRLQNVLKQLLRKPGP